MKLLDISRPDDNSNNINLLLKAILRQNIVFQCRLIVIRTHTRETNGNL